MTDADLLRAARRGDAEAWRTLYQRYLPPAWRQAHALVSDIQAAEDVVSEAMLALLRSIDRLDADAPKIAGWLRTVVRHKAADHQRKQFRMRETPATGDEPPPTCLPDASPSATLEAAETRNHVLCVLDELADRQRSVLEWKYLDSLSVREIADRLGDSEKAVEAVLYRARREFRRLFELPQLPGTGEASDRNTQVDTKQES